MAPKNTSNKVIKPKTPTKKSTGTTQSNPASPTASKGDPNALFLWECFKHSGTTTIDYQAVGDAFNISKEAARKRFSRLRIYFDGPKQHEKDGKDKDHQEQVQSEAQDEEKVKEEESDDSGR